MKTLLIALPGNEDFTAALAACMGAEVGRLETRQFPDGESYVRFRANIQARSVVLVCTLNKPDEKTLRLLFAAQTARELGVKRVGLAAPYLAYMRQDKRFRTGEAVTSSIFATILSANLDWIATIDPHLHRWQSMSEIYSIPAIACHAASKLSAWIREHVSNAVVIGPDSESVQWVSAVARDAGVPFTTLEKIRRGDRDVEVRLPDMERWQDRQTVLVDDIISSGRTMEVAVKHLIDIGMTRPIVLGVHGLFEDDAAERLKAAGVVRIVSTNSVPHPSNGIDVTGVIQEAVAKLA